MPGEHQNNKGNPVKQYEPFFSATSNFEDEASIVETGVTPIIHYDPLDRVIRTELPDGSESRVEFDAWLQRTFDPNDAVQGTTWLSQHQAGTADEQRAATLTLAHANTPTLTHLDTLGRAFLVQTDNGTDPNDPGFHDTRTELDIEGNALSLTDARGIVTMQQHFDVLARRIRTESPDAGTRIGVADAAGKPLRAWDSRGHTLRPKYDVLQRPTHQYVRDGSATERLLLRTVYGEALDSAPPPTAPPASPAQTANIRGKAYQLYDCAGLVTSTQFDFKGNLLSSDRRLATAYKTEPDWINGQNETVPASILTAVASALETETFHTESTYDALSRITSHKTPDGSVTLPLYNEASLLEAVYVRVRGGAERSVISNLDYNARGQRVLCQYANPESDPAVDTVRIEYDYDPKTFRLAELRSFRGTVKLQHLIYTYDPIGNIVALRDHADTAPLFNTTPVSGDGLYVYDALYRLIQATGREFPGGQPIDTDPAPSTGIPHANDTQALLAYAESYVYDQVGNIQQIAHTAGTSNSAGWTRNYQYATTSNRLTATSVPGSSSNLSDTYGYDAHGSMTSMPHLAVMEWDYADRLKHTRPLASGTDQDTYFTYDAAGQRVRKVFETVAGGLVRERIYLGGYEIYRERPIPGGSVSFERQTLHVLDGARRVAMAETKTIDMSVGSTAVGTTLWRFQLDNHLGSAWLELDEAGNVITYEECHPYGSSAFRAAQAGLEVSPKRYRYTGKERDEETGLYYYGKRYYAPWFGRWTSADPAGLRDSTNVYLYVRGSPIVLFDPTGLESTAAEEDAHASLPEEHAEAATTSSASTPREEAAQASLPTEHPAEPEPQIHPDNYKVGSSGVRLRADVPRKKYDTVVAQEEAAHGRYKLAEIANNPGLGCSFCHIVKEYSTRDEAEAALDLDHFNRVAVGLRLARDVTEFVALGTISKSASLSQQRVTVYRVEGTPNQRLAIDPEGNVAVQGEKALFLNFGDAARAEEFLAKRAAQGLEGATIKSFEVPASFAEDVAQKAVPEQFARLFPESPLLVDTTKAANQLGLRSEQIEELRKFIIQGTGRQ